VKTNKGSSAAKEGRINREELSPCRERANRVRLKRRPNSGAKELDELVLGGTERRKERPGETGLYAERGKAAA